MQRKKLHDLRASFRFLDNLYIEIEACTSLNEIKNPAVLKKFAEVIEILKNEFSEKESNHDGK